MCNSSSLKDSGVSVGPGFEGLELISGRNAELFSESFLVGLFVNFVEAFRDQNGTMSNSSNLSSQEMSFFSWEGWVTIDGGSQVAGEDMLDHPCRY